MASTPLQSLAEKLTPDDLTDAYAAGMPAVTASPDVTPEVKTPSLDEHRHHPKDMYGREFDPDKHIHVNGKPELTKAGHLKCWAQQKGGTAGKPDLAKFRVAQGEGKPAPGVENAPAPISSETVQSAEIATQCFFTLGQALAGDEWLPVKQTIDLPGGEKFDHDEYATMRGGWIRYFQAKGIESLPAETEIGLIMAGSIAARMHKPVTRSRLQQLGGILKKKVGAAMKAIHARR